MLFTGITPVHHFDDVWIKREDLAYWSSLEYPSGSKVRQYLNMAGFTEWINGFYKEGEEPPCLVGCSANSAMQVYVAATAHLLKTKGIIYTAQRKIKSDATLYAESLGAEINFIKPGYLSAIRKKARQRAIDLKNIVQWDRTEAVKDTISQCINTPKSVKRIIVPTGSGLTAAGVLIGTRHTDIQVVAVCTSPMADKDKIMRLAHATSKDNLIDSRLTVIPPLTPYDIPQVKRLPDDTPLDPFYAAKAWGYMQPFDLFWPPGLRPVAAMPAICRREFKDWEGPGDG